MWDSRVSSQLQLSPPVVQHAMKSQWRWTQHLQDRVKGYVNRPSRDGTYTELFEKEYEFLQNIQDWKARAPWRLVQLGFNQEQEVCKIGLVTVFPPCVSTRWLFLCLGADMGIKTLYVTPTYKHRAAYHEQGDIVTWTCSDLLRLSFE